MKKCICCAHGAHCLGLFVKLEGCRCECTKTVEDSRTSRISKNITVERVQHN